MRYITLTIKQLSLLLLLCYVGSASAQCTGTAGDGSCVNARITMLYVDTVNAYVLVDGINSMPSCVTATTQGLLMLPSTAPNFKAMYGTLLAMYLSSRSIASIRVQPGATPQAFCQLAYFTLTPG
jgi:hypothetical protein